MDCFDTILTGHLRSMFHHQPVYPNCGRVVWHAHCNAFHAASYQSKTIIKVYIGHLSYLFYLSIYLPINKGVS